MTNPWKDSDNAFDAFFDESIVVTSPDGKTRLTLPVAPFTNNTGDPLSEDMMDTERLDMSFVFRRKDFPRIKTLTRGWKIERPGGKTYVVSRVVTDA